MKPYISLLLLFISFIAYSQEGNLALKHFSPPDQDESSVYYDINKDTQGRLLVAEKDGLLHFDGKRWLTINTKSSPLSLVILNDQYYSITKNGIEALLYDDFFTIAAKEVFRNPESGIAKKLLEFKGKYFYLLNETIYRLSLSDSSAFEVDTVFSSNLGFNDLFLYQDQMYAVEGNFIVGYENENWIDLNLYAPDNKDFLFSIPVKASTYFFYDNGDVYEFSESSFSKLTNEITSFLNDHFPLSAVANSENLIITTLTGGALVVNLQENAISHKINYTTGLPENEVMSAFIDADDNLWLAHKKGLSTADLNDGLTTYHNYPYLKGSVKSSTYFNDKLFVGTTQGLYYLDTLARLVEEEKQITVRQKVDAALKNDKQQESDKSNSFLGGLFNNEKSDKEKYIETKLDDYKEYLRNKGFYFSKLRNRLNAREEQLRDSIAKVNSVQYENVQRTIEETKRISMGHGFKKIELAEKEVNDLILCKSGLLVIHADGIYLLNNTFQPKKLSSKRFIKDIFWDAEEEELWFSHSTGIYQYNIARSALVLKREGDWEDFAVSADSIVTYSNNRIYLFNSDNSSSQALAEVEIDNPFLDEIQLFQLSDNFFFVKNREVFRFQSDSIPHKLETSISSIHKDYEGIIWIRTNASWKRLNAVYENTLATMPVPFPSFKINDISYITQLDDSGSIIVSEDQLLRFDYSSEYLEKDTVKSFVSDVSSGVFMKKDSVIQLSYKNSKLKLTFSSPEFLYEDAITYRYSIPTLSAEWSDWSSNPAIEIPFIPVGEYRMKIQIKDEVSGTLKNFSYKIEVIPPYWQRWWFYVIEILFFSSLIILSIRLNKRSRNSYITNAITFLTLILFLEFISTVLENNLEGFIDDSPVYQFGLNVILALSITPLERFINGVLLRINTRKAKHLIRKMRNRNQN